MGTPDIVMFTLVPFVVALNVFLAVPDRVLDRWERLRARLGKGRRRH